MATQQETDLIFGSDISVHETSAASLLVIGRLAIAEYFTRRGQDPTLMNQMHGEAVSAWSAAWGCDNEQVERAISNIHASMCNAPAEPAAFTRVTVLGPIVGSSDTSH